MQNVMVIGGGAWGTALALTAARAGRNTKIWARRTETVQSINQNRTNPAFLPNVTFDVPLTATGEIAEISGEDVILLVTPAQTTRQICRMIAPHLSGSPQIILCAKGLDRENGCFLSEICKEELPNLNPSILSGPSFAIDVAKGLPTAVTLAASSIEVSEHLSSILASNTFRPYATDDIVGVQLGGALKNVLAIASGVVKGRGLGASAQSALIARGFAEIFRLGEKLEAKPETLTGLSGLGDLVLTCSSDQSRNFSFGIEVGKGADPNQLMEKPGKTVEGIHTAATVMNMAQKHGVELPICESVSAILAGRVSVAEAVSQLLSRPLRLE